MARTPSVPAKLEGHATQAQAEVQQGLAERTLSRLIVTMEEEGSSPTDGDEWPWPKSIAIIREALREANCNATLFDVSFWDLAGNSRVNGRTAEDEAVVIPCLELPKIGTIIQWAGRTYYIGSHKVAS